MKKILLLGLVALSIVGCVSSDPYQRKKFPPIPTERETPNAKRETTKIEAQKEQNFVNLEGERARFENPELFEPDGQIKPPLIQMKDLHPELFE